MKRCIDDETVLNYLSVNGNTRLATMCKDLSISQSTGRRILSCLEKRGEIIRYHGGAFLKKHEKATLFDQRMQKMRGVKDSIARVASAQVEDSSIIMLLGGTTVASMCPYLEGKKLTVITNSLAVLEQLSNCPNIRILLLGGYFNLDERELHGNITNTNLKIINADAVFISCVGFSPSRGYTTNDVDSVEFYRTCLDNSTRSYMLCDHTKSDKTGIAVFAQINEIDYLVTDSGMDEKNISELEHMGIKVLVADADT